jgi:hypothetical protein
MKISNPLGKSLLIPVSLCPSLGCLRACVWSGHCLRFASFLWWFNLCPSQLGCLALVALGVACLRLRPSAASCLSSFLLPSPPIVGLVGLAVARQLRTPSLARFRASPSLLAPRFVIHFVVASRLLRSFLSSAPTVLRPHFCICARLRPLAPAPSKQLPRSSSAGFSGLPSPSALGGPSCYVPRSCPVGLSEVGDGWGAPSASPRCFLPSLRLRVARHICDRRLWDRWFNVF